MSAERIRELNDQLRRTFTGGRVVTTAGVAALSEEVKTRVFETLRAFDSFTVDNDPHGEHDFGAFAVNEHQFFWKVEYYDERMKWGSDDPADPAKTTRVLTIMLSDEY